MDSTRILVVEDEPVSLDLLTENLTFEGYETTGVATGSEAWNLLAKDPDAYDVILLDRMMPDMDGIEILRRLKAQPVPIRASVIMQTALASDVDIVEGLKAGAYYYLTKPFTSQALLAIVGAAARDRQGYRQLQRDAQQATRGLCCLVTGQFAFQTPDQAWDLAALLAKTTPPPERAAGGLAELMLNAIEHGNLEIGYDEKSRLLETGTWREEIARRLRLPEHAGKQARVSFDRQEREILFRIQDQGSGFDWQRYMELSPDRAFHLHGRGIAMSRQLWFDRLDYLGDGHEVLAAIRI